MIRRRIILAIWTLALSGAVRPATGQYAARPALQPSDTPSVSVAATAQEHVRPDRAVVSLQVVSTGDSPEAAALANSEARLRTVEALEGLGYAAEEISLWGYGAGPAASGGFGPQPSAVSTTFEAKSGLRIVVFPLDRLDAVVSSALIAGASVSTVELESEELEAALRTASERAVSLARAKAEAMAAAAGGQLGELIGLATTPDYGLMSVEQQRYAYSGRPGGEGVQLFPLDGAIRVTVQATWRFVDR